MARPNIKIPLFGPAVSTSAPATHNNGEAFFKNNIPLVSPQYDANVQTGRAVALGATNDLPIPIHNNGGTGSFLTYHDIANNEVIQLGNAVDGGSKELVTDNTMDDSSAWPLATGFDIAGGIATCIDVNGFLIQQSPVTLKVGGVYRMSFDIGRPNTGRVYPYVGGFQTGTPTYDTGGSYTLEVTISTLSNQNIGVQVGNTPLNMTIDNLYIQEILPTSTEYTFNDVTLNNILTHRQPFSSGDLALIQNEPNVLASLALGEATPISSVTLDATDSWYAVSEESGAYVVDQRSAVDNPLTDITVNFGDGVGTFTKNSNTSYGFALTTVTTNFRQPALTHTATSTFIADKFYIVTFNAVINSGTAVIRDFRSGDGVYRNINQPIVDGVNVIQFKQGGDGTNLFQLYFDGRTELFDYDVTNFSIKEATASEIADYTEANRINQQSIGLQTTALELDGAGVPTAYNSVANTAKVYSDSIINTGFKPNIARYSIDETVSGEMQDFGSDNQGTDDTAGGASVTISLVDGCNYTYYNVGGATSAGNFVWMKSNTPVVNGELYLWEFEAEYTSGTLIFDVQLVDSSYVPLPNGDYTVVEGYNAMWLYTDTTYSLTPSSNRSTFAEVTINTLSFREDLGKTQRTERRVLTHTDAKLGDELCLDGGFDNPSDWNDQTKLYVEDSKVKSTGSTGTMLQNTINIEAGKTYRYSLDVEAYSLGNVYLVIGDNNIQITGVGTISGTATVTNSANSIGFSTGGAGGAGFVADNLTVREVSTENKYYIGVDGGGMVEQDVVPPLPDPDTTINLGNVAVLGYSDTVDTRLADFEVHSEVIVP